MCRLVAYSGAPLPLHRLLFGGEHSLAHQSWAPRELLSGSVNVDGYGVAWPSRHGEVLRRLARVEPVWHDPDLPGVLEEIRASRALAALRNATPGLPVGPTGLLPLFYGRWALALNGYVPDFRRSHMRALRAPLSEEWYGRLAGSGDAETLFLRVAQSLEGGAEPAAALVELRDAVAERVAAGETAPLTLVLLSPEGVTALHTTLNGAVNSLYLSSRGPLAPEGTLLASEPLNAAGAWEAVPPHSVVELREGQVEIRPL